MRGKTACWWHSVGLRCVSPLTHTPTAVGDDPRASPRTKGGRHAPCQQRLGGVGGLGVGDGVGVGWGRLEVGGALVLYCLVLNCIFLYYIVSALCGGVYRFEVGLG